MKPWADVWWVDEIPVLTISSYLLVLTQPEQGHGWMHLPYQHIYICWADQEPLAHVYFALSLSLSLSFSFLCTTMCISGGLFVPRAGTMQAVGSGTIRCSESREETARSNFHVILSKGTPSYFCFQEYQTFCPTTGRKKQICVEFT